MRRRPSLYRSIALLALLAYGGLFATRCASFAGASDTSYTALKPIGEELPAPPANFVPIRIVLLDFKNSASVSRFDVIPDGDYSDYIANVSEPTTPMQVPAVAGNDDSPPDFTNSSSEGTEDESSDDPTRDDDAAESNDDPTRDDDLRKANSETDANDAGDAAADGDDAETADDSNATDDAAGSENSADDSAAQESQESESAAAAEPENVDSGAIAREITETTLFQSGRFEVIPEFQFRAKLDEALAAGTERSAAIQSAARELGVDYIVYGALTDFEIRQQQDYWKLPLWAILLVGSFFIQDDDLRVFAWYAMLRVALVLPLNSPAWDYGIQWNNLDINVDVAMNLRLVDPGTASVVYSESNSVTRVENVRNLNLLVWSSNRRIKITQSNAGRQIRFVAQNLVKDLASFADAGSLRAPANPEAVPDAPLPATQQPEQQP
ncbi:MAG: hypothetical protein NXI24_09285 [bacterium]|nr:hypothetical protein [bacterium]